MDDYISISQLNDFIFCPYSIYLHNVYMEADEGLYHATPQTKGRIAHLNVDDDTKPKKNNELVSLPVFSQRYSLMGKIDVYRINEKLLIERKYQLKQIFQGQIYQLWAQYFCMEEMGHDVEKLAFYEISTNKMIPVNLPNEDDIHKFESFLDSFRTYDPSKDSIKLNPNKCRHCIYCSLCDKTEDENVY